MQKGRVLRGCLRLESGRPSLFNIDTSGLIRVWKKPSLDTVGLGDEFQGEFVICNANSISY